MVWLCSREPDAQTTFVSCLQDGIAAARANGNRPGRQQFDADRIAAALKLVAAGLSPTAAARQLGLGRSAVYREINRASVQRNL